MFRRDQTENVEHALASLSQATESVRELRRTLEAYQASDDPFGQFVADIHNRAEYDRYRRNLARRFGENERN